jgi:hypothetical protein
MASGRGHEGHAAGQLAAPGADRSKRNELLKEFQRYVSTNVLHDATWDIKSFVLTQPWIGNLNYNVNWLVSSFGQAMESQTVYTHAWLDDSKKKS